MWFYFSEWNRESVTCRYPHRRPPGFTCRRRTQTVMWTGGDSESWEGRNRSWNKGTEIWHVYVHSTILYTISICSPDKDKHWAPPWGITAVLLPLTEAILVYCCRVSNTTSLNWGCNTAVIRQWRPMLILLQMETVTKILIKVRPLSTDGAILILALVIEM